MADQPASERLLHTMQKKPVPTTKPNAAIEIKGSTFTLTVLRILTDDWAEVEAQLAAKLAQAPKFFHNAPMVLDLLAIATLELDIQRLVSLLQGYQIIPVGICNAGEAQQQQAIALGLGVFQSDKVSRVVAKPTAVSELNPQAQQDSEKSAKPVEPPKAAKMIVQPVRSGQRIYAKGTDLIVLAAVSPGAEVLADGNIHIYAPLRGRALAGADGKNTQARIFCQCLDAELLSIAGIWSIDAVDERVQGKSVQVYLEDNRLEIVPFPLV